MIEANWVVGPFGIIAVCMFIILWFKKRPQLTLKWKAGKYGNEPESCAGFTVISGRHKDKFGRAWYEGKFSIHNAKDHMEPTKFIGWKEKNKIFSKVFAKQEYLNGLKPEDWTHITFQFGAEKDGCIPGIKVRHKWYWAE